MHQAAGRADAPCGLCAQCLPCGGPCDVGVDVPYLPQADVHVDAGAELVSVANAAAQALCGALEGGSNT